jgi:hypothetical protein
MGSGGQDSGEVGRGGWGGDGRKGLRRRRRRRGSPTPTNMCELEGEPDWSIRVVVAALHGWR